MPEKSFHIITFGCQMNARDSQWLSAILKKRGFRETAAEDADFILLNTCSVREKPQKKIESSLRRIEALPARDRIIGVMGCVAKQEGEKLLNLNGAIRLVAGGDNIT
ncbi:MAG: tRNA (N6-isopentenyl adenosine(37)-C2)-methylthiotransferase MiaB, partial [Desulfovibrio sp.]|nr:tRNA (N6-isopentenyl adenosine(37)-C2)-methylthiotransferase MiaB [Desulfovibrio sp.]